MSTLVLDRFEEFQKKLKDDPKGLLLLESIKKYAISYVKLVENHENQIKLLRFRLEPSDFLEKIENLGLMRTRAHDALIDAIKIFHRYIKEEYGDEFPKGGIFTESKHLEQGRVGITEWALDLNNELIVKEKEHLRGMSKKSEHIKK